MDQHFSLSFSLEHLNKPKVSEALSALVLALGNGHVKTNGKALTPALVSEPETNKPKRTRNAKDEKEAPASDLPELDASQRATELEVTPEEALQIFKDKGYELSLSVPRMHNSDDFGELQARFLDYLKALGTADIETAREVTRFAYRDNGVEPSGPKILGGLLGSLARWCKQKGIDSPIEKSKNGVYSYVA